MITPTYDNILINPKATDPRVFTRNYPEFAEWLAQQYPDSPTLSEKLYRYFHQLDQRPVCEVCGKPVAYKNIRKGYSRTCSKTCTFQSSHRKESRIATCLERYGVENPAQSKEVMDRARATMMERYGVEHALQKKEFLDKSKATCREHYGVDYPGQSEELKERAADTNMKLYGARNVFASDVIKERIVQTNRERYGVDWAINNPTIKKKAHISCVERYGVDNPFKSKTIQNQIKQTNLKIYGVANPSYSPEVKAKIMAARSALKMQIDPFFLGYRVTDDGLCLHQYKCFEKCDKCPLNCQQMFEIPHYLVWSRKRSAAPLCTILNPIGTNNVNTSLESFVRSILTEVKIEYQTNVKMLGKKELDIYIPSHNLGIECNGIYWHSALLKPRKYHYNKWLECKNRGIQLLSIWEDWIIRNPNIVRSMVLSKLGIFDHKIGARQCDLIEIDSESCDSFLKYNHIQGSMQGSLRYGLKYKDQLVAVMVFSRRRGGMGHTKVNGEWELARFCNKSGWCVVGGASKLLNHFIKIIHPSLIYSFASHDISNGELYEHLGFKKETDMVGSYWYIEPSTLNRLHRLNFTKQKLKEMGYDINNTEFEIVTEQLGLWKIYDSGMTKYILKLS